MKFIISIFFKVGTFLLLTSYSYADISSLPTTTQMDIDSSKVEVLPEITIQVDNNSNHNNKNLKEGKSCDFSDLEEAEGELFVEIPMAETLPCQGNECKNLKPAQLKKDNYRELQDAQTIAGCK